MEDSDKKELQNLREEVKQLKEQTEKNGNNLTRKIFLVLIPLIIVAGFSSYMGVMTAEKVNRVRIKNNFHKIERLGKTIDDVKDENNRQWKYIIDFANTRGEKINPKKDE